ncbi:MAG: MarC family protein [Lentisphaeraceae bacterium]|nr:MarC family protein [Lentisphaeraceae bacterium]
MNTTTFLHAFTSYFVIIDPIGAALIFNALTSTGDKKHSFKMACKTCLISISIVLLFGFFGGRFLSALGIGIASFRVAGGLLLFSTAYQLVTKKGEETQADLTDISVFPMSIPIISGPGTLALTVLLFSSNEANSSSLPVIFSIISIYFITFICFLCSSHIKKFIGRTGDDILQRLLGVVLAALAIQFIGDGLKEIFMM